VSAVISSVYFTSGPIQPRASDVLGGGEEEQLCGVPTSWVAGASAKAPDINEEYFGDGPFFAVRLFGQARGSRAEASRGESAKLAYR
jgi:hypothetical protein